MSRGCELADRPGGLVYRAVVVAFVAAFPAGCRDSNELSSTPRQVAAGCYEVRGANRANVGTDDVYFPRQFAIRPDGKAFDGYVYGYAAVMLDPPLHYIERRDEGRGAVAADSLVLHWPGVILRVQITPEGSLTSGFAIEDLPPDVKGAGSFSIDLLPLECPRYWDEAAASVASCRATRLHGLTSVCT